MNQSDSMDNAASLPELLQNMLQRGYAALQAGQLNEASECCRLLLTARSDLVEAHFLAGLIARQLKDRPTAINALGTVIKLNPEHPAAHAHLAQIFMMAGQANLAYEALRHAVQHEAGDADVQSLIGNVFFRLGDQGDAYQWHARAVSGQPENPTFIVNHANSLVFHGKLGQAEDGLRKALKLEPGNPQAHWILSGMRRAENRDHIEEMRALASQPEMPPQATAFFYYAMGKELEDLQQWDEAFEVFSSGAQARRSVINYDEMAEITMFRALADVYTTDWLEQQAPGLDDPSPIFIVGQPRTGTTLVERVITSHSQVHSAGELRHFAISVRRLAEYREPQRHSAELMRRAAALDGSELGQLYFDATKLMRGFLPRFVDKMPLNYQYIPLILNALPNAKIIHLQRKPMDACFSSFKQLFADAYLHSYEQREMARHHSRYLRLMDTWRQRFPGRFFDIAYEDIARDLEPHARAIIDHLELPWEDSCLQFHQQDAAVTTASSVQVREPAHTRSIDRWRKYQGQLRPMRDELEILGVDTDGY